MSKRIDNYSVVVPFYMHRCLWCKGETRRIASLFCTPRCTAAFYKDGQGIRVCGFYGCRCIIPYKSVCLCVDRYNIECGRASEGLWRACDGCGYPYVCEEGQNNIARGDNGEIFCSCECYDVNYAVPIENQLAAGLEVLEITSPEEFIEEKLKFLEI